MNPDPNRIGVSRRRALRLALGGAAVTLLAACAPIAPANPPSSAPPQQTGAAQLLAFSSWFTDIQTPDKYTVILKTDVPRAGMFDALEYLYIVDQPTVEGPDAKSKVGGTGPFMWSEWQPGVSLRMDRNPN